MQILEWVGGFLYAITTLYLLHRNNRIMQDQNQIMREQGGAARRIANERTWWKIYWPMLVMAALTALNVCAITKLEAACRMQKYECARTSKN